MGGAAGNGGTGDIGAVEDDEAVARTVEALVARAARAPAEPHQALPEQVLPTRSAGSPSFADGPSAVPATSTGGGNGAPAGGTGSAPGDAWNGLPAPWEPLPPWLASAVPPAPPAVSGAGQGAVGRFVQPIAAPATARPVLAPPAAAPITRAVAPATGTSVQLAAEGRDLPDVAPPVPTAVVAAAAPAEAEDGAPSAQVEPDLDSLARQVYAVLRRRLAAEGRRFG
jgi:hypothetical protein